MTFAGVPRRPRQDVRLTGLSVPPADSLAVSDIVAREALRDQGKPLAGARVGHRRQTEPHDPALAPTSNLRVPPSRSQHSGRSELRCLLQAPRRLPPAAWPAKSRSRLAQGRRREADDARTSVSTVTVVEVLCASLRRPADEVAILGIMTPILALTAKQAAETDVDVNLVASAKPGLHW